MKNKRQSGYGLLIKKNLIWLTFIIFMGAFLFKFYGIGPLFETVQNYAFKYIGEINSTEYDFEKNSREYEEGLVSTVSLLGEEDVEIQPETDIKTGEAQLKEIDLKNIDELRDINKLKSFYIVDKRTAITEEYFNVDKFLSADIKIDNTVSGPKILIFHTHASETYADSASEKEGVIMAGDKLEEVLENKYGIETLHYKGVYDMVDGKKNVTGAYEREEADIRALIAENPSIQMVIDLHRDGVNENVHLVKEINGKNCAQIMFFNGICKLNKNGALSDIPGLSNPYVQTNLALSFNAELTANSLYPGLARKIYINAYRYSLHMCDKSMLIELGAQTNTKEEVLNSIEPLADIIANTVMKK